MNIFEAFTFVSKVLNLQGFYFSFHTNDSQLLKSFRAILSIIYYVLVNGLVIKVTINTQMSTTDDDSLLKKLKGSTIEDNLIFSFFMISRPILILIVHLFVLVTTFTRNQNISMLFQLFESFDDTCVTFLQVRSQNKKYSKVIYLISFLLIGHIIINSILICIHSGSSIDEKIFYIAATIVFFNLKFHVLTMVFIIGAIKIRLNNFLIILKSKTSIKSQNEFNLLIKFHKQILKMIQLYNRIFGVPLALQMLVVLIDILAMVSSSYTQFYRTELEISANEVVFNVFNSLYFVPSVVSIVFLMFIADQIHEVVKILNCVVKNIK